MRYELKVTFPASDYKKIIDNLFQSKYMIKEIYHKRQINNIYFDTLGYSDYLSNFHGDSNRKKYRIRWYNQLNGCVDLPTLEMKYKQGMTGGKKAFALPQFTFDGDFSYENYKGILRNMMPSQEPNNQMMLGELLQRNPVLVNSYERRYFLTADQKYRITVDDNLKFSTLQAAKVGTKGVFSTADPHIILEIKFDAQDTNGASKLVNDLGYRIYKNSKYVNGINTIMYNASLSD